MRRGNFGTMLAGLGMVIGLAPMASGQDWAKTYVGSAGGSSNAASIAADSAGNSYVAGGSEESLPDGSVAYEFTTIKYNSQGQRQWVRHYLGAGNATDGAVAVKVDSVGNLVVTGDSVEAGGVKLSTTIKYDTNGNQLWIGYGEKTTADFTAVAMGLDSADNVYVLGTTDLGGGKSNYTTIKFDTNGNRKWSRLFQPSNSHAPALVLAVSSNGDVTLGDAHGNLVHYGTGGNVKWTNSTNASITALTCDSAGDILTSEDNGQKQALRKYLPDGTLAWTGVYDQYDPSSAHGACNSITTDSANNVYAAIWQWTFYGRPFTTLKYDTNGQQLWVQSYQRDNVQVVNNPIQDINFVAVDSAGNVVVTGINRSNQGWYEYQVLRYDPNGNLLSEQTYHSPGTYDDQISCMALDSDGNIYVSGAAIDESTALEGPGNICTVKFSP